MGGGEGSGVCVCVLVLCPGSLSCSVCLALLFTIVWILLILAKFYSSSSACTPTSRTLTLVTSVCRTRVQFLFLCSLIWFFLFIIRHDCHCTHWIVVSGHLFRVPVCSSFQHLLLIKSESAFFDNFLNSSTLLMPAAMCVFWSSFVIVWGNKIWVLCFFTFTDRLTTPSTQNIFQLPVCVRSFTFIFYWKQWHISLSLLCCCFLSVCVCVCVCVCASAFASTDKLGNFTSN